MDININELKKICIDFFNLAETGFSLWDENRNNIFSYPEKHVPFCKAIRDNKKLYMNCAVSDKKGLDEVDRTKKPYIYTCHMGLTEAIVPILQDEEIAGYLMMGQIAEKEKTDDIVRLVESLNESREVKKNLEEKLWENTCMTRDKIEYCVNILKILIEYMNLSYVFKKNNDKIVQYIFDRYNKEFNCDIKDYEVVNNVSRSNYPVLLSAGSNEQLEGLFEAIKNVNPKETEIIILPGCNHGNGMYKQTELYQGVIKNFVSKHIK